MDWHDDGHLTEKKKHFMDQIINYFKQYLSA